MRLVNRSNGEVIAEEVSLANNFTRRLIGLMGRKTMRPGSALAIVPCRSIHTFFIRFPIDVIFLDRSGTVLSIISGMRPYKLAPPVREGHMVVELPGGTIKSRVNIGDVLIIMTVG